MSRRAPISGTCLLGFDNAIASVDGAAAPACGGQIEQDARFCRTAPCTGPAAIWTCSGAGPFMVSTSASAR